MDSHEPEPSHPHPHHLQPENVAPNPLATYVPTTMMELATTQFPILNMESNPSPFFDPFNNGIGPSTLKPCVGASSGSGSIKKKRGRPRKYFLDDNITLSLGSGPIHDAAITYPSNSIVKKSTRGRGRPRGSFKKKQEVEVLGVTGTSFSPHLIIVNPGEDIVEKLKTCCQGGSSTEMSILSAHGLVGIVSLHQEGRIVTYEDKFELLSLSGTLEPFDDIDGCKRMSNFKVSLLTPNSHLLVGVVADKLIAASLVKITVGSFTLSGKKASSNNLKLGSSSTPSSQFAAPSSVISQGPAFNNLKLGSSSMLSSQFAAPAGVISQGPSFGSSSGNENSPFSQGSGIYNNANQLIPTISMYQRLLARQSQL